MATNLIETNPQIQTIERIGERYRRRMNWHKTEKILTLQGKAMCRRICDGDKEAGSDLFERIAKLPSQSIGEILVVGHADPQIAMAVPEIHPLIDARALMARSRAAVEKEYETLAWDLPVMEWIESIDGVGPGSLVAIIGNTGNLWNYPTVQKLWKRMGLAVATDGRRQRNIKGASEEERLTNGYSAQRRSAVWNIGTSLMFAQTERKEKDKVTKEVTGIKKQAGLYRTIYDNRRAYEEAKNEAGDYAPLARAILASSTFGKTTEAYKAYSQGKLPKAHLKARAQRYMEKEFVKQLWINWRRTMTHARPIGG